MEATSQDDPRRASRWITLGQLLESKYATTRTATDLDRLIDVCREIREATLEHSEHDHYMWGTQLVVCIRERYSHTGAAADLAEAISIQRAANGSSVAESHPDRAMGLSNLGLLLSLRYTTTGSLDDLDEAIQLNRKAVEIGPGRHEGRLTWLNNLAGLLHDRFLVVGELSALEEAIEIGRRIIDSSSMNDPRCAVWLSNLASRLESRHTVTGARADHDEAIRLSQQAIDTNTPEDDDRLFCLRNHVALLGSRFRETGDTTDLTKAIQMCQETLDTTHENQLLSFDNLALLIGDRFRRTGLMGDLDDAIRLTRELLRATPPNHTMRAIWLVNLAVLIYDKFQRTMSAVDIEEAILLAREALDMTPENHPSRAENLSIFGVLLGSTGRRDEAILVAQEAVSATPVGDPRRTGRLGNLVGLIADESREIASLDEAIDMGREAVCASRDNDPYRSVRLNNLAQLLRNRFNRDGLEGDLDEAIDCFTASLEQVASELNTRINAGLGLLRYSALKQDWRKAYEAADATLELIPRLASRSLQNMDRQHVLSQVASLASNAAAAALHAGQGPVVALQLLEKGRDVMANTLHEMRADVLDLQRSHPELADRFGRARDHLLQPLPLVYQQQQQQQEYGSLADGNLGLSWKDRAEARYRAADDFDKLLTDIRAHPGFSDFLLASTSEQDFQAAAAYGPIVVVNTSRHRCDAIIVEKDRIRSLALPNLNYDDAEYMAQHHCRGTSQALEWLWDAVARPILDALGFTQPVAADGDWPRIWWILTYPLSELPLHAAGYHFHRHPTQASSVLDRVMSSYSLSIRTMMESRKRRSSLPASSTGQALLVDMQHTPGRSTLPFAATEIQVISSTLCSMGFHPITPGRRAGQIKAHLPRCQIFHFAGHGHVSVRDPSKSGLLLEDWMSDHFTVATLMAMNLHESPPFLAYLSACGTGQVKDDKVADESIHLISACQLAGFRHVIGTLWEVDDEHCVDMARITYGCMKNRGLDDRSVCLGLHEATRKHRDAWVMRTDIGLYNSGEPIREEGDRKIVAADEPGDGDLVHWVPYVHYGI